MKNKNLLVISVGYPSKNGIPTHTFVKDQVDELSKSFNKIIVICPLPYFPKSFSKIEFIPYEYRLQSLFEDYKYNNIEVYYPRYYTLPIKNFQDKIGSNAYYAVDKCIKDNNIYFNLIHSHFTYPSGYIAAKLKHKYRVRTVLTTHGLHHTRIDNMIEKQYAIKTWNNTDHIINVSFQCSKLLEDRGINNVSYIPNMVDLSLFQYKKRKSNNTKIIVSVGNLVEKKGFEYLIEALWYIKNKLKLDFKCYIIGDGHLKLKLQKQINKYKLEDKIILVGSLPHDKIVDYLNKADLFVLNSFVENFGVVNVEALACGVPVVSTINGGSEEIIISDELGFLSDNPKNYLLLSYYINKALNKKWSKKVLINYSKQYSKKRIANKILEVYRKLI